jgi:hypothetical protein
MNRLLLILILTLSFQSWTKANDIRDFEIEGVSVFDRINDHITEKKFLERQSYAYNYSNTFSVIGIKDPKYDKYEKIRFTYKNNDLNRVIYGIDGVINFDNKIGECLELQKIIADDVRSGLKDFESNNDTYNHWYDKSNNSKVHQVAFDLPSGAAIVISCFDWSDKLTKEKGWIDNIKVSINTKELTEFFISLN